MASSRTYTVGVLFLAQRVLDGEVASIVRLAVVPGSLHSAATKITADQPRDYVGVLGAISADRGTLGPRKHLLSGFENVDGDDGGMCQFLRPDSLN